MDSETVSVFLPNREDCYERLRRARFGATVACVHCSSDEVIKKGTTGKDAQQYYCNRENDGGIELADGQGCPTVLLQRLRDVFQRSYWAAV